jgi:hypothetical protein
MSSIMSVTASNDKSEHAHGVSCVLVLVIKADAIKVTDGESAGVTVNDVNERFITYHISTCYRSWQLALLTATKNSKPFGTAHRAFGI